MYLYINVIVFLFGIKMKANKIVLGLTVLALVVLMVPSVLANGNGERPPGYSPGYWKHQLKAHYNDRGHMQESWDDMLAYEAFIQTNYDAGFTLYGAYLDFTDTSMNNSEDAWLTIANWFNDAAGLAPYTDND